MTQTRLGHVGIYITDVAKMIDFYTRVLGFVVTDADKKGNLTFLSRSATDHHQIVLVAGRDPDVKETVQQVSFNLDSLEDVQAIYARIVTSEAYDLGPVTHGIAWSIYFRDPEGNRLEMFTDTPWYIPQPCRIPIDLARPAADLRRETENYCRAQPGFRSIDAWREEYAEKMAAALQ